MKTNRTMGPTLVLLLALAAPLAGQESRTEQAGEAEEAYRATAELYETAAATQGQLPRQPWASQDPADGLYRQAREALNRSNYRQAAELYAQLAAEYGESAYAADALYWQAFALYRTGSTRNLQMAADALLRQAEMYAQAATRSSGDARALEARIRGELAKMGDAESAEYIALQATQEVCDDEDEVRMAALNALLQMDSEKAVPILIKALKEDSPCDEDLKHQAIFLISQHETPETEALMIDLAKNDPDPEIRMQAVFWLSNFGSDQAADVLMSILDSSDDPDLQLQALFALGQHGGEDVTDVLREYALDESHDEDVRAQAIFWLMQQDEIDDTRFLRDLYDSVESEEIKQTIFHSLSQQEDEETVNWMMERALDEDEDMEVRGMAIFWATQAGMDISRLEGLYERMDDQDVRQQLIMAYGQSDDPAAVDRLIQIARAETDPELKKHAIFWLGQSNDPRAADFLLTLLEP
jgi:HEAT repeat protein